MIRRLLLATCRTGLRDRLLGLLPAADLRLDKVRSVGELWERLRGAEVDLVLVERALLDGQEEEFVASVRSTPRAPEVVVLCRTEEPERRARLLARGALAVLCEEVPDEPLAEVLAAILERLAPELVPESEPTAGRALPTLRDFDSSSPVMRRFLELVRRVAVSDASLLITGETGVGKEWLARAVHSESPRARAAFVAVNCAGLPESLLDSELFGHEQGAFTGAIRARRGRFELAHGGTLFLDEIGDMPVHMQAKLLRVLQEREIQPVGSEDVQEVDVRVMAATNADVERLVEERRFRRDLYYRLGVVTLEVPPLRERREDIERLVETYVRQFAARPFTRASGVEREALEALTLYDWPGNVRELINVIERAMLLGEAERIGLADLPPDVRGDRGAPVPGLSLIHI